MQRVTKRLRPAQLSLFQPTPMTVAWTTLPSEVREQSVRLLARLLREHCARRGPDSSAREARDE